MLFWAIHFPCYFITITISFCNQLQLTPLKKISLLNKNFLILTCMTSSHRRWCCSSPVVKSQTKTSIFTCFLFQFSSAQSLSRVHLCDPMNCSTPGLPIHHQLPESTQTRVHWIGDAIQPFHPLLSASPALNLSQHEGLFKWVSSSQSCQIKK